MLIAVLRPSSAAAMLVPYSDSIITAGWTKVFLLLVALLVGSLGISVCQILTDPLKDIPGPTWARFTRLWLFRQYIGNKFHKTNLELHKKYGEYLN
jgi:hypothetical protein